MQANTIRLLKGSGDCSKEHDTIQGPYASPEVLKTWHISEEEQARAELAQYRCKLTIQRMYCCAVVYHEEVYALQYCQLDASGEPVGESTYLYARS